MQIRETADPNHHLEERRRMVDSQLWNRGIRDQRVLGAMLRVPRHEFVPEPFRSQAYGDHPIPIGQGQTISQPFIVALSLEALELRGTEEVLEIGTGSGYQTALLAELARAVYSVERHRLLAQTAETMLARLGFENAKVIVGDGSHGLREFAPYDAILVSAAAPSIPESLLHQLGEGGRMVIPVGPPHAQELERVRRQEGKFNVEVIEGCRFVPLIGAEGY